MYDIITAATTRPPELPAPNFDPVRRIHRADDGFIPFAAKPGGEWQNLFSVPTAMATTLHRDIAPHLTTDAYFSINSMCRAGRGRSKAAPSLPAADRKTGIVRYLNAAYSDLDVYKAATPTTAEETLTTVRSMVERKELPLPSFTVLSGRGVWLLWLLHDPATGLPVVGDQTNLPEYRELARAIQRRLAHLGADPQSTDIPRVMRVPGSIHSGTGQRVVFHPQTDAAGQMPVYTLSSLRSVFPVEVKAPPPGRASAAPRTDGSTTAAKGKQPSKRRGWLSVFESRVRQIQKLGTKRGGYAEGCRNHITLVLADALIRLRRPPDEVEEEVYDFRASCIPPLSEDECKYVLRSAHTRRYKFSNDLISDWLEITPAEAEQLDTWKPATRFRGPETLCETQKPKRGDLMRARRQALRMLLYEHGGEVLPVRSLVELLKDRGHVASHTTVWSDLRAMGLVGESGGVCGRAVSGPVLVA